MRIVLDTNIVISALFWDGLPRAILDKAREKELTLLTSEDIETELIRVLGYERFGLAPFAIQRIMIDYATYTERIKTTQRLSVIKDDLTDNIFLECAIEGRAKFIISGDKHLLTLKEYEKIKILKPREFKEQEKFFCE